MRSSYRAGPPALQAHFAQARRKRKWAVLRACGHHCVYCGELLSYDNATVDHVFPVARGGSDGLRNLVASCSGCNRKKGARSLDEFIRFAPSAVPYFLQYARAVHHMFQRSVRAVARELERNATHRPSSAGADGRLVESLPITQADVTAA